MEVSFSQTLSFDANTFEFEVVANENGNATVIKFPGRRQKGQPGRFCSRRFRLRYSFSRHDRQDRGWLCLCRRSERFAASGVQACSRLASQISFGFLAFELLTQKWGCRGCSSAGRARRSQCRGQGFDPPHLHHGSGSILPARIALTESDSNRRDQSLRRVFGEPRRWIFHVTEASADTTPQVAALRLDLRPVTGSSFDPAPSFTDDPPLYPKDSDTPDSIEINTGFQWRPAINQSMMLLGIQHGYALIAQEKMRQALKGPFFRDYWRSLKGLSGWDDGNRFFTNYIAHPMQGGLTGFIYVQNSPRAMRQQFGESKEYWKDRFTAFLWSTAWSTQFELGPISQSTIGNLGMYGGMAYVDLVITPTVGTGWLISEEALDRYVIRKLEAHSFVVKMFLRSILNPMRSVANVLRFREPWYRDRPFGY
jgi:hypothetical protein